MYDANAPVQSVGAQNGRVLRRMNTEIVKFIVVLHPMLLLIPQPDLTLTLEYPLFTGHLCRDMHLQSLYSHARDLQVCNC